jgi:hypothetical protein
VAEAGRARVYVAATGAAITGVALTPVMGATSLVFWLGAWRTLQTVYEEVARICHAHGRDDLVPPEQRHR